MEKKVFPWKSKFCRGKVSLAVEKKVLPWKRKSCRGKESLAVEKKVLPWKSKFCRGKVSFAVSDVSHRIVMSSKRQIGRARVFHFENHGHITTENDFPAV